MITREQIDQVRKKASGLKALVIGDAMIDRYIYGTVDRISPEAPVPILSHQHMEVKAGGAANVALNLKAWGCQTSLVGLTGDDPNSALLGNLLDSQMINHHFFKSKDRPTTVKTRIVASSRHLLRIDEESEEYLHGEEEQQAMNYISGLLTREKPDLVILEDYNKGFLTPKIISAIIHQCKAGGIFIAVDPKEKNFFQYQEVDLFKPNLREAGQAARTSLTPDDLSDLCTEWRKAMNINIIAITLGSQGVYLQNKKDDLQVVPGQTVDVIDVCGAGDAVICSLALGIFTGLDLKECGTLANVTGAYVCSHSGVVTVDVERIHQWI